MYSRPDKKEERVDEDYEEAEGCRVVGREA